MVSMVSTSDVWYQRDLGVRLFAAIEPNPQIYTGRIAYNSNFDFDYFNDMRLRVPSFSEDAFHVFTGKQAAQADLNSLAGIAADIGSLCREKANSIAISIRQRGDSVAFVTATFAHELGHLAALTHDDQSTGSTAYLMHSGTVSTTNSFDEFSNQSKSEWTAFLNRSDTAACFPATEGTSPTPAPLPAPPEQTPAPEVELEGDLYQHRVGRRDAIIIEAYRGDEAAIGEAVVLYEIRGTRERRVLSRRTNSDGIVVYYPPRNGSFYAVVGRDGYETDVLKFRRGRR
jgi:hypothetical protein